MSFFHALLSQSISPPSAPVLIHDSVTSSTVDLFWEDVDATNYIVQQDGVQIYSGTALTFQATGLSQSTTYAFRVKAQNVGGDSAWTTINVTIPAFYNVGAVTNTTYATTAARQTSLESGSGGVDVAFSVSFWIRWSNVIQPDLNASAVNVSDGSGNDQWSILLTNAASNTVGDRIRLLLQTNTSNNIVATTTAQVEKNKWMHVVVTYDGSEANTGITIYINGSSVALTLTSTGTYTGALSSANLRFRIGHFTSTKRGGANISDVCVWSKELSGAEASELYNAGVKLVPSSVSFYADVIAYYPLSADTTCTNNSALNLTNNGITFVSRAIRITSDPISFKRSETSSSRYVAFGGAYRSGDNISWYGRSGTTHLANGKIIKIPYTISTRTAGTPVDVITDGTYDLRGGSAGLIGSTVFVMSSRYNTGADTFIDARVYESTDGATGETFDAGTAFSTNYTRYNFYGEMVTETINGTTYTAFPFYGHNGSGTWKLSIFYTTNAGSSWTKVDVFDGASEYGEPSLIYADGYWMLLSRRNDSPYGIYRAYSTDLTTWSSFALTNLGGIVGVSNCATAKNSAGLIYVVVMDRSSYYLNISKNNRMVDLVADPTGFNTPAAIFASYTTDSTNILGYPSIQFLDGDEVFISTSAEFSASRADHYFAFGKLNEPN